MYITSTCIFNLPAPQALTPAQLTALRTPQGFATPDVGGRGSQQWAEPGNPALYAYSPPSHKHVRTRARHDAFM